MYVMNATLGNIGMSKWQKKEEICTNCIYTCTQHDIPGLSVTLSLLGEIWFRPEKFSYRIDKLYVYVSINLHVRCV